MSLNTYPYNPFPASTDKLDEAHNADLQQEVDQLKNDTEDLQEDVENLETDKTDTTVIAPSFDAEAGTYDVGDLVTYEGKLYEFTSAHSTAGAWDPTEVTEKTVADEIDSVKSGLTNAESSIANMLTVLTVVSNDSGLVTNIAFPEGYHSSDCIVLAVAINADPSNNLRMWGELIDNNNATGHYVYVDTNALHLVVRDTANQGKTFNIVLTKKSLVN